MAPCGVHVIILPKRFECRYAKLQDTKRQELGSTSAVTSNTQIAVQAYLQHRCKSDQTQDRLNRTELLTLLFVIAFENPRLHSCVR